jgi:hypothetical protein
MMTSKPETTPERRSRDTWRQLYEEAEAEVRRLRRVEIAARNVAVNANRGNDGVSAVPGCVIDDLREALRHAR